MKININLDYFKFKLFSDALTMGMTSDEYWLGDPNMIFAFQKAFEAKQKIRVQEIWMQGRYFKDAIQSSISFSKNSPPKYPEMPFTKEMEEDLAQNPEWVERERTRAYNHFMMILNKKK